MFRHYSSTAKLPLVGALSFLLVLAACASMNHIEPYRDIACFERAAVSLPEAVTFAQVARPDLIIDAEYNCNRELGCLTGNRGGYDITYYDAGRLERVNVCPVTGAVRPPLERGALERLTGADFLFAWPESEMRRGAPAIAEAPVTMLQAITIAEETSGTKAMAVHVRTQGDKTYYAIELVKDGLTRISLVDPVSGRVTE